MNASGLGAPSALAGPRPDQFALKLRKAAKDDKHEPPGGGRRFEENSIRAPRHVDCR